MILSLIHYNLESNFNVLLEFFKDVIPLNQNFSLIIVVSNTKRLATLMRALSTCDKQNLLQWWRRTPRKRRRLFESMNSAVYVHIYSELKYLLVHEF